MAERERDREWERERMRERERERDRDRERERERSEELHDLRCEVSTLAVQVEQLRDLVLRLEANVSGEMKSISQKLDALLSGEGGAGSPLSLGSGRGAGHLTPRRPSVWSVPASALRRESGPLAGVVSSDGAMRRYGPCVCACVRVSPSTTGPLWGPVMVVVSAVSVCLSVC